MKQHLPKDNQDFCNKIDKSAHERWDKTPISVMVFGPNTDREQNSSVLRKYLIQKCHEYGVVVRTEHEDFVKNHRALLGKKRNLCGLELNAAKHVDAIVMIPDSPGSFVELGMFSFTDIICRKTLILFSSKYEKSDKQNSFVFQGPKLAYKERGAKFGYIDYDNKNLAWNRVKKFLHAGRASKWEQSLLNSLIRD